MPPPPRRPRAETREIAALKQVALQQPALASAVGMQIELLALQRRVEARLSTPWVDIDEDWVSRRLGAGRPIIRFGDIPIDWTEFRLLFRQVADLLHRFDLIERRQHADLQQYVRSGRPSEAEVASWYDPQDAVPPAETAPADAAFTESLAQVLELTARPFVARVVATTAGRVALTGWEKADCPFCGGAPEMAVSQASDLGVLACGRCAGTWPYDVRRCVHCGNDNAGTLHAFASADRLYQLTACDACGRYVKAYDASAGRRPLMLPVDTIATLPLDAAAQQRGYQP